MLSKGKTGSVLGMFMVAVMFFLLAMAGPPKTQASPIHTIMVTQGENGIITPVGLSGVVSVLEDANKLFTITPKVHHHVTSITVDGASLTIDTPDGVTLKKVGTVYKYLFTNVTTDNHTITATYSIDAFALTVSSTGTGSGTITGSDLLGEDPPDISFPSDDNETYNYGTTLTLTAAADAGTVFVGWSGACVGKNLTCTVKVTKNKTAVARFRKTYNLTVTVAGTGTGTVKALPQINCGLDCEGVYKDFKVVTLVAIPESSSSAFGGWSGDAAALTKTIKVTMDADKNITATFEPKASGIKIAEKVSVVDTTSSPGVQSLKIGLFGIPEFPADSAYNMDQTTVYVNERSAETFKTINEILCMVGQTKYDEMLNKGNYKAQIDKNMCSSSKDDPSSAGQESQDQSSGSTMPKYEMWTVSSSRVDDNHPQILKAWIHEPQEANSDEPGRSIFAKVVITEPVTETNPYGVFTIDWKMFPEIDGTVYPVVMSRGILKTEIVSGKVLLKFAEVEDFDLPKGGGHEKRIQQATLDRAGDGSSGGGTAYHFEQGPWTPPDGDSSTFDFAFNPTNFLRAELDQDGEPINSICLDRTQFDETAWRYGMYDSNGARINRDSAFSIKKTQDGKDYYGSIGYYGIWFPREVTLNNGDQVYKMEFGPGGGTGDPYNVLIADGKLKKHVRKEMILGAIKNVPLDYWDNIDQINYRVKWDGTNFIKFQWLDQSGDNYLWKNLDPITNYDISNLTWDMLNFWSQSLGGNVQIKLACIPEGTPPTFNCTASDDLPVVFYAESVVFPGDTIPTDFTCFNNCPDLSKINSNDQWPYNDYGQPQLSPPAEFASYTFDGVNMVLKSGANPVIATSDTYQFGVMSGPLFEPTTDNLSLLACDWDPSMTCGWQAWNKLDVFYTWETGPNDWNKFTALYKEDQGTKTFEKFDPPLQVSYVHQWDPQNPTDTSTFNLDYSGFGNLWGIPGKCIDWNTGNEVDCSEGTRWIPQFSIAAGSEVTDVSDGTTRYYVKPLEEEQRMKQVDISVCTGLTPITYNLPNISQWQDPNIGTEPKVEGPPAVIGGVLQ